MQASLEDSILTLGEETSGTACCGQYKYYAFPSVEERLAPLVHLNLTSGNIKVPTAVAAVWRRWDACLDHGSDGCLSILRRPLV